LASKLRTDTYTAEGKALSALSRIALPLSVRLAN
jgi:hypothetical protein